MPNLSWLYYKGYYQNFEYWNVFNPNPAQKKAIQGFFEIKNKQIENCEPVHTDFHPANTYFILETTYPGLLIGSGYAHETGFIGETKLGLQLDYTTGMPVIAGSSVKGIIRSAFPQFPRKKSQPWEIQPSTDREISESKAHYIGKLLRFEETGEELFLKVHQLEQVLFEGLNVDASIEKGKSIFYSLYERDIFYDAFLYGGAGKVGKSIIGPDAITPHGNNPLKNPTPISFMKVLPGVSFTFHFNCGAPTYFNIDCEKRLECYKQILLDMGAGAKTNVGYGKFVQYYSRITKDVPRLNNPTYKQ